MIVYLAHPVAPTDEQANGASQRRLDFIVEGNIDSALGWLKWLVDNTDWAICAPWLSYVQCLPDVGEMRERGIRDDCAMAARCDAIVLCGGRVSSGMVRERDAAQAAGAAVIDLTDLGESPPDGDCRELLRGHL